MPRVQEMHRLECLGDPDLNLPDLAHTPLHSSSRLDQELHHVHFKGERMYKHNLFRINFTAYDVRRRQDVINPRTPHCDILVLAAATADEDNIFNHRYCYGRVIGIYHVNVVYTGSRALNYRSHHIEFLWVRWFHPLTLPKTWKSCELDRLAFMPVHCDGAFGFVDPTHVLRACHILPRFSCGMVHSDGIGISCCAKDGLDYLEYYVNRYVIITF